MSPAADPTRIPRGSHADPTSHSWNPTRADRATFSATPPPTMKTTRAVPSINSWLEGRKDGYGRKGKTHQTKTATPRRNWNQELARVLRDLPRGTPVTVRFSHILRMEWSVDADTMPEGFCDWLRQTRKELAPFFTIAARDLRQYLVSASNRGVPTSTIHRLFIMDMADTPTAQRHNADIKVALRAFATYQTVKHHPLARDAARLWWQAPAAADAKKRLINAMASATWEDGQVRAAPPQALQVAAAALRRRRCSTDAWAAA